MIELKERLSFLLSSLKSSVQLGCALGVCLVLGKILLDHAGNTGLPEPSSDTADAQAPRKSFPGQFRFAFQDVLERAPKNTYRKSQSENMVASKVAREHKPSLTHAPTTHPFSQDRITRSLAKVLGEAAPVPVQKQLADTLPRSTGSPFAIQVASFSTRGQAQVHANALKKKGYDARVVLGESLGKQRLYRVRLHGFNTLDDAERFRESFELSQRQLAQTIAQ
jgi:cell division protein FtsN